MNNKSLSVLFYGILMGTANKIPGVSGGLVAIAIGFYEKLDIFSKNYKFSL
jgi:putative membrane protein